MNSVCLPAARHLRRGGNVAARHFTPVPGRRSGLPDWISIGMPSCRFEYILRYGYETLLAPPNVRAIMFRTRRLSRFTIGSKGSRRTAAEIGGSEESEKLRRNPSEAACLARRRH